MKFDAVLCVLRTCIGVIVSDAGHRYVYVRINRGGADRPVGIDEGSHGRDLVEENAPRRALRMWRLSDEKITTGVFDDYVVIYIGARRVDPVQQYIVELIGCKFRRCYAIRILRRQWIR